jgi:hypothetical protein
MDLKMKFMKITNLKYFSIVILFSFIFLGGILQINDTNIKVNEKINGMNSNGTASLIPKSSANMLLLE